ncbi:MAG: sigma factor, partial [Terriglobales bacterium]
MSLGERAADRSDEIAPAPALDCVRLVERILAGDQAAEEALVRYFQPRVSAMLLARTRDRELTLDLQQEVLWESIAALRRGQLREPLKLCGFVLSIARNRVNNHFRSSQQRPQMTELPA